MITSYGVTDKGLKRNKNEDYFVIDPQSNLFLVADGMGGHQAGEVASELAAKVISNFIQITHLKEEITWPFGFDPSLSLNGNRLKTAIKLANRKVWKLADTDDKYMGMGTTVIAALIGKNVATIASVGDSRAYLIRNKQIIRLTKDDSLISSDSFRGELSDEEIKRSPLRHIITSAVGASEDLEFNVQECILDAGDYLLLCSDGLYDELDEADILRTVLEGTDLEWSCKELVRLANEAGGDDNITVVLLKFSEA